MTDDITEEEDAAISRLESGGIEWQAKLADHLRHGSPARPSRKRVHRLVLLYSLAAAVLIFAILITGRNLFWPSPEALLAKAYREDRTIELRIPGADPAPIRVERGSARSDIDQRPVFLQAEALISRKLHDHPGDRYWLEMESRADLLAWNYSQAIDRLSEVRTLGKDDASILTDLATAYFERGEAERNPADFAKAAEFLGQALDLDPKNETALFNRALILEKMQLYSESVNAWKQYLGVYPNGKWAKEARENQNRSQTLLDHRVNSSEDKVPDPGFLVSAEAGTNFGPRAEEYVQVALENWATEAYPTDHAVRSSEEARTLQKALQFLASYSFRRYDDPFLNDLFSSASSASFPSAILHLSSAIKANRNGHNGEALSMARASEIEFRNMQDNAGVLRARYEQIYEEQMAFSADKCLADSLALEDAAHRMQYRWLEAQSYIEHAFCENELGRVGSALIDSQKAAQLSVQSGFHETYLRASIGVAVSSWEGGQVEEAWRTVRDGLNDYWKGNSTNYRGMTLCTVMDAIAEYESEGHLQSSIIREYLRMIDERSSPLDAALGWYRLGNSELEINHDSAANEAFHHAQRILASLPPNIATEDRRLLGTIGLAKVKLHRGQIAESAKLLDSIRTIAPSLHESFALMDFFDTEGDVSEQLGNMHDAAIAYHTAIAISEKALSTLTNVQDRMTWSRSFTPAYRGLVDLRLRAGDPVGALAVWEWYHSIPLRADLHLISSSYRPSAMQSSISDEATIQRISERLTGNYVPTTIIYALIHNKMAVWVLGKNGLTFRWLEVAPDNLKREAEQFYMDASDPSSNPEMVRTHGRKLYNFLIAPVEDLVNAREHLAIEANDPIEDVPFGALINRSGEYFGAIHAITYSLGLPIEMAARPSGSIDKYSRVSILQGLGSDSKEGLLPDPESSGEVQDITGLFPRSSVLTTLRSNTAMRERIAEADVIHYSGHTRTDVEDSGLLLGIGNDGRGAVLTASDLYQISLPHCHLVVLAGCSTGLGTSSRWIDRDGFVLPFLSSGVPCVIASRWPIDSATARKLMRYFYEDLLSGKPIVAAFQSAKLQLRSDAMTGSPYYWASFDIYGPCGARL